MELFEISTIMYSMNTYKGFSTILLVFVGLSVIAGGIYILNSTGDEGVLQTEQEQLDKESLDNNLSEKNTTEVDNKNDKELLRTYLDLNNDGFKEMITSDKQEDGKIGLIWQVSINNGDNTYSTSDNLIISFSPNAVGYSKFPGDNFESLLTYVPSNANEGVLVSYRIQNNEIIQKYIVIEPAGKDEELYKSLIQNPFEDKNSKVKIEEIRAGELR